MANGKLIHGISRGLFKNTAKRNKSSAMWASIKGGLPSKVVFFQRSSSFEGRLPLLVHFHFWVFVLSVA